MSFVRIPGAGEAEVLHFDGRLIFCDVSLHLRENVTAIRTHGDPLLFEKNFQQFVPVSIKGIDTIIRLVDAASLCLGNAVDPNKELLKVARYSNAHK